MNILSLLGEKGLINKGDVPAIEKQAASSGKTVEEITNEGINLAAKAFEEGKESIGEFNFRRKGYAVAVAIILLLAVLVYLKVRQIEKRSA